MHHVILHSRVNTDAQGFSDRVSISLNVFNPLDEPPEQHPPSGGGASRPPPRWRFGMRTVADLALCDLLPKEYACALIREARPYV